MSKEVSERKNFNWKELLANIGGVLFIIFIIVGWFQPEGYWWFVGLNPYDLADRIFKFLLGLIS
jgi:hypothetical protein